MYAKIAVVVIVALVGVASAATLTCSVQSEVPVLDHPTFSAYLQFNGTNSYLPLNYKGHSSEYGQPIKGISRGRGEIRADCGEILASLAVDEAKESKFYGLDMMSFSKGQIRQTCTLHPMEAKDNAAKHYACKDANLKSIATLVIERLNIKEESICQMRPMKLCPFTWVEAGQN